MSHAHIQVLCGIQRKINRSSKMKRKERANAQIAHLVFADTQANPEKPKELFFCLSELT